MNCSKRRPTSTPRPVTPIGWDNRKIMGELLIVWSARIVVLFYALRLAADVLVLEPTRRERWTRWVWTAGCALFLAHLALAFHFLHHWSHAAAVAHTAQRTNEVVGFSWGGGVYINYAFT